MRPRSADPARDESVDEPVKERTLGAGEHAASPDRPYVSVVVPVRNDKVRIAACIEALLGQTYPSQRFEIIIVDNDSDDDTREVVQRYAVTLLSESRGRTPYLARNTGIEQAQGEVIALTDATCSPAPDWIEQGVRMLEQDGVALVGGRFEFTFSSPRSAGESYDSVSNLEMERNVRERGVAKTGNLFFRRSVFDAVGPFPAHQRSGADVGWTGRATRAGFRIAYAPNVVVRIAARGWRPLLKKQFRVGQGQPAIWRAAGEGRGALLRRVVLGFVPPSPGGIRRSIRERGIPAMESDLVSIWAVAWACKVVTNLGRVRALLRSRPE